MQHQEPFKVESRKGWQIRWRDPDGRYRQKGGFQTKDAARDFREAQLGYAASKVKLSELVDRYLKVHSGAESTKKMLRWKLNKATALWGDLNPARLTGEELEAWRLIIPEGHRFETTQALKQTLRWGVEKGLLAVNPAASLRNPQPSRSEKLPFESWDEIEAIAAELGEPGTVLHTIPLFAAGTGLRPGEWLCLRRSDLQLDAIVPSVNVVRRLTKDGKIEPLPKNGETRRVPLRPRVVTAVKALPPRIDTPLLFPPGKRSKSGHIDLHNFGQRDWKTALESAGIAHRRVYDLRHTFATWAIAEGLNSFHLARVMGTSVEMIDRHYGHLLDDADALLMRAFVAFDERESEDDGRMVDAVGGEA
jgi:integrase